MADSPKVERRLRVALIIGAGGLKCAAGLGVCRVLKREGIQVDMVVGCSGGSIFASEIALGYDVEETIERVPFLWPGDSSIKINRRALFQAILPRLFGFSEKFGLLKADWALNNFVVGYGDTTFAETRLPLFIVATDFYTGEAVVIRDGTLADAMRASSAIPALFPAYRLKGRLLVDGALANPMPVDVAIKEGAEIIIAIGFKQPLQDGPASGPGVIQQTTNIMANSLFSANFAFDSLAYHSEIIQMTPQFDRKIGAFDLPQVPHIIEQGEKAAQEHVPYLRRLLGAKDGS